MGKATNGHGVPQLLDFDHGEPQVRDAPPQHWTPRITGDDSDFWKSTPSLRYVYQWSLSRLLSPYVVLMGVLCRLLVAVPPNVVLPALIGASPASLNLDVCVVGYSAQGKDSGIDAASVLVPDVRDADTTDVSSGEGIAAIHAVRVPDLAPETGKPLPGTMHDAPRNIRAILLCTEAAALAAQIGRRDNTLVGTLNKAWCGSQLGGAVKAAENNLHVPKHGYRQALVVASQPAYVGTLAAQHANGFFQRLVWADAYDRRISHVPVDSYVAGLIDVPDCRTFPYDTKTLPQDPAPAVYESLYLHGSREAMPNPDAYPLVEMKFPKTAYYDVVNFRLAHNRDDIEQDDPDAHSQLIRMKLAAALHFLDHDHKDRPCDLTVSDRDWKNAGRIMEYSSTVRMRAEAKGRESRQSDDAEQIADRNAAIDMAEAKTVNRAKNRIIAVLTQRDPAHMGLSERDLRNSLNSSQRKSFRVAIEALKNENRIHWEEGPEGGVTYSLPAPDDM